MNDNLDIFVVRTQHKGEWRYIATDAMSPYLTPSLLHAFMFVDGKECERLQDFLDHGLGEQHDWQRCKLTCEPMET